jgi:acetone carboxylase, beta subunit
MSENGGNGTLNGGEFLVAIDAGGTMTDCILFRDDGDFHVGKALTHREDERKSYLESVSDAAGYSGLTSADVHARANTCLYTGTAILNTILTLTGARVGLIVTRGWDHIMIGEGALTWLGEPSEHILHQQLRRHTAPLVPPGMVIGVSERIIGGNMYPGRSLNAGDVIIPLNESEVVAAAERLLADDAEVIGIMFLNSFVNPAHELQAKEIVERVVADQGKAVRVITSHEVAPVMKEHNRTKSLVFQAYAAEKAGAVLRDVESVAKAEGYRGRLLTLLSYGGAVDREYPRLYETVISGPIGGLTGAQVLAKLLGLRNVVTADLGGTSFDVGVLVDHMLQVRKTADFARHRLATSMVAIDSIGSGAGSVVRVDDYGRIHLGPESAGQRIGVCYEYPELTVTDINVALGYVDPDYFLGGKIKLNRDRALAELEERVAKPLGLDPFVAGAGVLDVGHTQMRDLLRMMLLAKGYNPAEFTALCYGGAGPVHMRGFTEGIGLAGVITVPWAAGFSAYGAGCAEYYHRYEKSQTAPLPLEMTDAEKETVGRGIDAAWRELEQKALAELRAGAADVSQVLFRYGVYARYMGQLESFDTPLEFGRIESAADLDRLVMAFEKVYTEIYPVGARFPEGGYAVTDVYLHAVVPKPMPTLRQHALAGEKPTDSAYVGSRQVFNDGEWRDFEIWQMEELRAGNVVRGPSIIRDPMTTVVIPQGYEIGFDQWTVMHYRAASTA